MNAEEIGEERECSFGQIWPNLRATVGCRRDAITLIELSSPLPLKSMEKRESFSVWEAEEILVNSDADIIHDVLQVLSISPTAATQYSD